MPSKLEKERILQSSRELILKWVKINISACLEALDHRLFKLADSADNNEDQTRFFQAREELKQQQQRVQQRYLKHIYQAFDHYREMQHTATDYSIDQTLDQQHSEEAEQTLSLVDNSELEEKIAIGSMSR